MVAVQNDNIPKKLFVELGLTAHNSMTSRAVADFPWVLDREYEIEGKSAQCSSRKPWLPSVAV